MNSKGSSCLKKLKGLNNCILSSENLKVVKVFQYFEIQYLQLCIICYCCELHLPLDVYCLFRDNVQNCKLLGTSLYKLFLSSHTVLTAKNRKDQAMHHGICYGIKCLGILMIFQPMPLLPSLSWLW